MPSILIKKVNNKYRLEFGSGGFDKWCIYLTLPGKRGYPPKDIDCFNILRQLGNKHGDQKIYDDFVKIYDATSKQIDATTLQLIEQMSTAYGNDADEIEIWFTVLYAGMIAEENKDKTVLGKSIKRLGVHQLLVDKWGPGEAANFSVGKGAKGFLIPLMKSKGF
jgi:hypothetical protein